MAKDLVSVAAKEIGYKEGANNYTKYGAWLGTPNIQWCQAFVTWCCFQSGVGGRVSKTASTDTGMAYFKKKNRFEWKSSYFPQRNDIIYFKSNGSSHVGIVEKAVGNLKSGTIYVIEGNYGGKVCRNTYNPSDKRITGYGLLFTEDETAVYKINYSFPKPENVVATSPSDNTLTVKWKKYSNIVVPQYNVYVDGTLMVHATERNVITFSNITSGNHTVWVAMVAGSSESERASSKVKVGGKNLYPNQSSKKANGSMGGVKANQTGTNSSSSQSGKEELKYLKQFLKTINKTSSKKAKKVDLEIAKVNYHHNVNLLMIVQNGKKRFTPPIIEDLKVVWERKNTAGKMTFQTISSKKYPLREGNAIRIDVNGKKFFYGFVFTVKTTKDKKLEVTVYDQLRYLKAKDTYVYKRLTTNTLIKAIAGKMGMNIGKLEDTKHKVTRAEDNISLFDMISNSLNETLMATGKVYTLFDDCGKLTLKQPTEMRVLDALIDADTAQDYDYNRSIDQDVYNQIKLAYTNDNGKTKFYYTKSKKNISKWGTLQYFEKIDYPKLAKIKGEVLLKLYNKVSKTLTISGAFGNTKVRAGSLVPVLLDLGDAKVSSFLLVDKVTHMFSNGIHKMDLSLSGGGFDSSE